MGSYFGVGYANRVRIKIIIEGVDQTMSKNTDLKKTASRILHLPVFRILIGIIVCAFAMLATNGILRFMFGVEGDALRIIRWLLSSAVLISTYYYFFKHYEHREILELKLQNFLSESLSGLLGAIVTVTLIVFIMYLFRYYEVQSIGNVSVLMLTFIFFVTAAALEEIIFRGIIYRIVEDSLGTKIALILSALLFGGAHVLNEHANVISIMSAASGGIILGLLYSIRRRLWLPIAFHAGWNWALASFGTVVSGNDDLPSFLEAKLEGPDLITGGAFGMENSIVTVGLILFLSGIAYYLLRKENGVIEFHSDVK